MKEIALNPLLQSVALELRESGSLSSRLDAELLICHAFAISRVQLITEKVIASHESQITELNTLLERRKNGEPIAYILGEKEFFGRPFVVSPAVLIPRPETELIVERASELVKTQAASRFLELGTGSGCISVTLLAENPTLVGIASDVSMGSLLVAAMNAQRHGVRSRIDLCCCSWLDSFSREVALGLIVSNPPYVGRAQVVSRECRFEPEGALFAENGGFEAIQHIIEHSYLCLRHGGSLLLEIGDGQAENCQLLGSRVGYRSGTVLRDLAGKERVVQLDK